MHVACRFSVPPGPSRRPKRDIVIENGWTISCVGGARRRVFLGSPTGHLMLVTAGLSVDIIAPRLRASCEPFWRCSRGVDHGPKAECCRQAMHLVMVSF